EKMNQWFTEEPARHVPSLGVAIRHELFARNRRRRTIAHARAPLRFCLQRADARFLLRDRACLERSVRLASHGAKLARGAPKIGRCLPRRFIDRLVTS